MGRPFRFAIQTGPFAQPDELRTFASRIEAQGYAELFSYDHIGGGGGAENTKVDPFLPLLVAAEATTTLRFGPLVLNNEFHNPVLLARTAATFDCLTGGRLVLGLGSGYARAEHEAADIPLRPPGPRVTRLGESITALRALFDEGSIHCQGEHIKLAVDDLGIRPVQARLPILVGGNGRRMMTLAGRQADIVQFTGLTHDRESGQPSGGGFEPDSVAERVRWFTASAGDRLDRVDLSLLVQRTCVGPGADEAGRRLAAEWGVDDGMIERTPFALFGSEGQVIEKLEQLRDEFGIHHVVSRGPDDLAPVVAALSGR